MISEKEIKHFKFIGETFVRGKKKFRWECPICRSNNAPECRFNLDPSKINMMWKCKFCKNQLMLKK